MREYQITHKGQPKGTAWRAGGRWHWQRPANGGIEIYARGHGKIAVRRHLVRLCGGVIADVKLTPIKPAKVTP
jgi:hypothetical protein